MIQARIVPILLLCVLSLPGAKDKKAYNEISADTVTLSGKAYMDPEAIKQLLGYDLGGHYIVVQMTVDTQRREATKCTAHRFPNV